MSVVGDGDGVGVLGVGAGMTQTDAVLEFLRMRGPLTQPVAQEELGCLRLGARIWDLKQRGFAISTELVELASGQRVAEYSLGGSSTPLPGRGRSSTVAPGRGSSTLLPGDGERAVGSSGGAGSGGVSVDGSGVGLRDGVTLDVALGVFGDLVMDVGVSPTVREFGRALGVSSESVAHRWVRVLEGEGLLAANAQLGHGAVRGWVVSAAGFERLYRVERGRRLALERAA
jgi:helix-turn-helix protein